MAKLKSLANTNAGCEKLYKTAIYVWCMAYGVWELFSIITANWLLTCYVETLSFISSNSLHSANNTRCYHASVIFIKRVERESALIGVRNTKDIGRPSITPCTVKQSTHNRCVCNGHFQFIELNVSHNSVCVSCIGQCLHIDTLYAILVHSRKGFCYI